MNIKLLFAFLIIAFSGISQSENFRFRKLLSQDPSTPVCFAIKNDGKPTLDYLQREKVTIKYITKEWLYVTMAPQAIAAAQKSGAISQFYYEFSNPVVLNDNDTMRVLQKVNQVHAGAGGLPSSYTGKNVIIGYIDQGLDYNHPDFRDANGHTRVLRYWDHTLPVNAAQTPLPYGYGQAWDSTEIANGVSTSNEAFPTAHGTTVAGAGSGNGLANGKNKGVAPDSKIIVVETNFNLPNWTLSIADACDYIFKVADTLGLPAVINLSVGTYFGSHDGNDPASLLMESLLDQHPGRIIVSAAGNAGTKGKFHVHGEVDSDTSFVWIKNNPSSSITPNSVYFDLWSDQPDFANVKFAFGADKPAPAYGFRGYSNFHTAAQALAAPGALMDVIRSPAGDTLANIELYSEVVNGTFHMEALLTNIDSTTYNFRFATKGSGSYDMWSGAWQGLNDFISVLPSASIEPDIIHYHMPDTLQSIVSSWNCSEKVISVGNMRNRLTHINNNGQPYVTPDMTIPGKLSPNSSKGPSRLGVMKPDISASGDVMLSPGPLWLINNPAYNASMELGGKHARNGGTSMASPVVAGIAALYLEKCSSSTYADFKRDLTETAVSDGFTGSTPNYAYGYGKADALNALLFSADIEGPDSYCNIPVALTAGGGTVNSVLWSNGSTTNPLIVNQPGTYNVTVNYNGTCQGQATIVLPQGTVPATPLIAPNGTVLVASTSANYQWYLNGNALMGQTNQTIAISVGGAYTVSTTGPDGCVVFSAPYQSNVGIDEFELNQISVFPNPTNGTLEIAGIQNGDQLSLHDLQGKKIRINKLDENKLDLSAFDNGIYILTVLRNGSQFNIKIIRN